MVDGTAAFQVGSAPKTVQVQIFDENGNLLEGFSSVMAISLPSGAGSFSNETFVISKGQSEKFLYYPGTLAGQHNLTINIPGIGIMTNTPLTLAAGNTMYMDSSTKNGQIIFTLRDRYGNETADNFSGIITKNAEAPQSIQFQNGKFSIPEQNGFYIIEVPEIKKNVIYYSADGNVLAPNDPLLTEKEKNIQENKIFQILPISKFALQISSEKSHYDFRDDYNARYSVLAGGSYIREGEDILYHSAKDNSQSLAVTTLLDSPYAEDTILSVFPGGGFAIGSTDDSVFESSVELERGFPVVHISDTVRKNQVAKIMYRMDNAILVTCKNTDTCDADRNSANIFAKILLDETI